MKDWLPLGSLPRLWRQIILICLVALVVAIIGLKAQIQVAFRPEPLIVAILLGGLLLGIAPLLRLELIAIAEASFVRNHETISAEGYESDRYLVTENNKLPTPFSEPFLFERREADWFSGEVQGQKSWLVRVVDGPAKGRFLALASDQEGTTIDDVIERLAFSRVSEAPRRVQVVVFAIDNPGSAYQARKLGTSVFG